MRPNPGTTTYQKTFQRDKSALMPLLSWIKQILTQAGFTKKAIYHVEIAAEEVATNIMFHGKNCSVIEVLITVSIEKMVLTFQDEGPAFDSERHRKTLDPSLSIDQMEVGGLGILLMQKLVDDLSYTRDKGRNILSLTKKNSA